MTPEVFLAMASFAFVMAFTPGPNNVMLTASAANFGFVPSIPHMLGVTLGFVILVAASGAGLGSLLAAVPSAQTLLKVVSVAYMLWLAWKVANAGAADQGGGTDTRPLTFFQAAAFQWINPKGVIIALGAITLYVSPARPIADLSILLAVFGVITMLSTICWSLFGAGLGRLLRDRRRARMFNVCMALLLVASIVPMVL
jgi:threonine/homoserine/homoserine lactone efflux protein